MLTPADLAHVLSVMHERATASNLNFHAALEAGIREAEKLAALERVKADPSLPVEPDPLGRAAYYVHDHAEAPPATAPHADAQSTPDGQHHRVVVYFGADAPQAKRFADWVNLKLWHDPQQPPPPLPQRECPECGSTDPYQMAKFACPSSFHAIAGLYQRLRDGGTVEPVCPTCRSPRPETKWTDKCPDFFHVEGTAYDMAGTVQRGRGPERLGDFTPHLVVDERDGSVTQTRPYNATISGGPATKPLPGRGDQTEPLLPPHEFEQPRQGGDLCGQTGCGQPRHADIHRRAS